MRPSPAMRGKPAWALPSPLPPWQLMQAAAPGAPCVAMVRPALTSWFAGGSTVPACTRAGAAAADALAEGAAPMVAVLLAGAVLLAAFVAAVPGARAATGA